MFSILIHSVLLIFSHRSDYNTIGKKDPPDRRIVIFKFDKFVHSKGTTLEDTIIQTELSKIIVKSLVAYRMIVTHVGNQSIWDAIL